MHQCQSLFLDLFDHDADDHRLLGCVFRQEYQPSSILALFGNGNALQQDEFVRNLNHDSCAITRLVVGTFSTTVAHVLQNLKGCFYDVVRFLSVDIDDHSDTTGVVLVSCVIQSLIALVKMISLFHHLLTLCVWQELLLLVSF